MPTILDDSLRPKNHILNSNMNIWQRGNSFVSSGNRYAADRFLYVSNGTLVDISRATDAPANSQSVYSFKINRTVTATPLAGEPLSLRYYMEGLDLLPLKGKTCTISFWVKSTKTGSYALNFRNADFTKSLIKTYTINTANTWEFKSIVFTHDASGSWNYDNTGGLRIYWIVAAGSGTTTATTDSWISGTNSTSFAHNAQVNIFDTANASFQLTQVMLNEGAISAPFKTAAESAQAELAMCLRYYELVWNEFYDNPTTGSGYEEYSSFKVEKRASPNCSIVSQSGAGNAGFNGRSIAGRTSSLGVSVTASPALNGAALGWYDLVAADAEL